MSEWDYDLICRDERCDRIDLHRKHLIVARVAKPHHRPKPIAKPTAKPLAAKPEKLDVKPLWRRPSPKALTGAVARATSKSWPTHLAAIARNVADDYGPCCKRTVYRHVKKLVERGHLIKLDLGMDCCAYIRPKSKLLDDLASLREHMEHLTGHRMDNDSYAP